MSTSEDKSRDTCNGDMEGYEHQSTNADRDSLGGDDRSDNSEDPSSHLPVDRGWAWVVMIASFLELFVIIGHMKCFGIVFLQLQQRFGSSSSETSLIFTLQNAMYSVSALLVMTLGASMSARRSALIGTGLLVVAFLSTGYTTDVRVAYFSFGVVSGIGNGFIVPQFATVLNTYFSRWIGLANNFSHSGVSVGGLTFAPALTALFEHYGFNGTYMLMAAFHLHVAVFACLLRPLSFYDSRKPNKRELTTPLISKEIETSMNSKEVSHFESNASFENVTGAEKYVSNGNDHIARNRENHAAGNRKPVAHRQISDVIHRGSPQMVRKPRIRYTSEGNDYECPYIEKNLDLSHVSLFNSSRARLARTDIVNCSLVDLSLSIHAIEPITEGEEKRVNTMTRIKTTFCKILRQLFDVKLLSKIEFQYFLVCNAFLTPGAAMASGFVPQHSAELGVSRQNIAWVVSGMSILEFLSRFVFGFLSDRHWFPRSTLIAFAALVLGVAAMFFHFMTSFPLVIAYTVIAGSLQGVYFALISVVIVDIFSAAEFKSALGFLSLVQGMSNGISLPLAGYIRDATGSYYYTFTFIGGMLLIGGIMILFLPKVVKVAQRRREQNKRGTNILSPS